jgi:hypothetical protein
MHERIAKWLFKNKISYFEGLSLVAVSNAVEQWWLIFVLMVVLGLFNLAMQRTLGLEEQTNEPR